MAGRNVKRGLVFFRLDTDFFRDRKIRRLLRRMQGSGILVYLALLTEIYRDKGYYVETDSGLLEDVADTCEVEDEVARQALDVCLELGLFDRDIFVRLRVLTSAGIQRRYLDMIAALRRKGGIDAALSLISSEEMGKSSETKNDFAEGWNTTAEKMREVLQHGTATGISAEGNGNKSEERGLCAGDMRQVEEEAPVSSDKRKEEERKREDIHTDTHVDLRKGGAGGKAGDDPPRLSPAEELRDEWSAEVFGRPWADLSRPERMFLWAGRCYPVLFRFERPLTVVNCESILRRVPDWVDVDRVCEAIANRKDVLEKHVSAVATFNSFARMDKILQRK